MIETREQRRRRAKKKPFIILGIVVLFIIIGIIAVLLLKGGTEKEKKEDTKYVTITFDSDGGSKVESKKVKEGGTIVLPESEKEGYALDGWYDDDTEVTNKTKFKEDTTLKAKWKEVKTFKVTFDTKGGSKIDPMTVVCDEKLELPEEPTKEGYSFVNWKDKKDKEISDGDKLPCEDITLTANWQKEADKTYRIVFDTKGGSSEKSLTVNCGDKVPELPIPTKSEYTFVSWADKNGKVISKGASLTCEDITLTANWEKKKDFKVTFDSKGGSSVSAITVKCGNKLPALTSPTKNEYKFVAWTDKNGKAILEGALLTCDDVTLYADWKKDETAASTFDVTFDSNGGSAVSARIQVKCGNVLPSLPKPTREGYTFVAWTDINGKAILEGALLSCENIQLKADWKKNETATPTPTAAPSATPEATATPTSAPSPTPTPTPTPTATPTPTPSPTPAPSA